MAEIERCYRLKMAQHLKLPCASSMDALEFELHDLRIETMHATRPEDVLEILAGIPDTSKFNAHLNHLIFHTRDGLLEAWRHTDGVQIMNHVGRVVRVMNISQFQ